MWVYPIVNAPAGRLLGAYDLGVVTPRAVVDAGNKTSGDARCVLLKIGNQSQGEEFKDSELSGTRTILSHSSASSDSTTPLSLDHPLTQASPTPTPTQVSFHHRIARMAVRTQPTLSLGMSARIVEAAALSPSSGTSELIEDTKGESSELDSKRDQRIRVRIQMMRERESHSLDDESHGLDDEGQGLEDEGLRMEEEEAAPEGQQQAVLVVDTAASEPLGLGYKAARRRALKLTEEIAPSTYKVGKALAEPVQTLPSPEWSRSLQVLPLTLLVPSPIALPVATSSTTISRDEDQFLEVGAQLELNGGILYDRTQRLDALPPILFEGYDRDLRELYTRSGAVRDEIFSQRYRFMSLEREQERATVTFSAIWRMRENHDLRRQIAEERYEQLELTDHVAMMERRQESGGE
ncbi:hypothetical protein Tco_1319217 [Tanacetum coccineum]